MYKTSIDFHNRVTRGEKPELYIVIHTQFGARAFAGETLSDNFDTVGKLYDGSYTYNGDITYGDGDFLLSKLPLVKSYGGLNRTLSYQSKTLLVGATSKRQGSFTVVLNNADKFIEKMMQKEIFITRQLQVIAGFEDVPFNEHLIFFNGTIDETTATDIDVTVRAVES